MSETPPKIALFAKFPRAGEVKTRLASALGEEGAAQLHRRLAERTLLTLRESGLPFAVWTAGAGEAEFRDWLGEEIELVDQGAGDLGERLSRVRPPAIALGADVPDLTAAHLRQALRALEQVPVVIGPARDGGYYLIGFRGKLPFLWRDIPWGTERVLKATEERLRDAQVPYSLLETLDDCDRPGDLAKWPDLARLKTP